jgi:hypothetical protein
MILVARTKNENTLNYIEQLSPVKIYPSKVNDDIVIMVAPKDVIEFLMKFTKILPECICSK